MNKFYTQKEVAEMFRCSKGTVIDWSKKGHFDVWRSPENGRVLYTIESVDRFCQEHFEQRIKKTINPKTIKPSEKPSKDFKVPTNIYLKRRKDGKENKSTKPPPVESR